MSSKNADKQPRLFDEQFIPLSLDEIVADRFGRYAKYIIQDRALPDARDGLKPVQRRILHAMSELGLTHDKPHKKSARTVGEVIGKYHPHGDQSIYDAMVRMAQDWKNNAPLVDMHGNKGSIDGDNAAAMRYTEARLAQVAQLMMEDIKKQTVRFVPNFDDSETEPSVLPGKLPNLLVNGATGIAAGYATNIPPHNLVEVVDATIARIDSPNCRVETLLKAIRGPDFPTGGVIQGAEGIKSAFTTGKGRIILRAKMFHEKTKTANRWVVTEIPYDTVKSSIVREIDEIRLESKIGGIEEVRDESDRTGLRISIDLKKDAAVDAIRNYLLKNTSLQVSYNINMVTIVDRKPVLLGLGEILDAYISHQLAVMVSAATWDLAETVRRVEIVEGLIKAVSILDDVVETIRRSADKEDAKKNLCDRFGFTNNQAEAIVQLRLYRLTSTNVDQLRAELNVLLATRSELEALLGHEELRKNKLKSDLRKIKSYFGRERKSAVEDQIEELHVDVTQTIANEKLFVVCSHDGYLKTVSAKSADLSEWDALGLKPGDWPVSFANTRSLAKTVLVTAKGKYVTIPNYKLPSLRWKDLGQHLNTMTTLDASDKVIAGWQVDNFAEEKRTVAMATKKGLIKRVLLADLEMQKYSKPSTLISMAPDDEVVGACLVNAETDKLGVLTANGFGLAYEASEVAVHGTKAAGIKAIALDNDRLAALVVFERPEQQLAVLARSGGKRIYASEIALSGRANKGRMVWSQLKGEPLVMHAAFIVESSDSVGLVDAGGKWSVIKASDIPIADKDSRVSHLPVRQIAGAVCVRG